MATREYIDKEAAKAAVDEEVANITKEKLEGYKVHLSGDMLDEMTSKELEVANCAVCGGVPVSPILQCKQCNCVYCSQCTAVREREVGADNGTVEKCQNKNCKSETLNVEKISRVVKNVIEALEFKHQCSGEEKVYSYGDIADHLLQDFKASINFKC